jgi:hypothetical protein
MGGSEGGKIVSRFLDHLDERAYGVVAVRASKQIPVGNSREGTMQAWIRNRAKTRKDGRMVFVTSVSFDVELFDELSNRVPRERQRSAIVNAAIRYCLALPGWLDSIQKRLAGEELAVENARAAPSSNSRIHARGGVEGPKTKRSPGSRPPKSKGARSSKRGGVEKKK